MSSPAFHVGPRSNNGQGYNGEPKHEELIRNGIFRRAAGANARVVQKIEHSHRFTRGERGAWLRDAVVPHSIKRLCAHNKRIPKRRMIRAREHDNGASSLDAVVEEFKISRDWAGRGNKRGEHRSGEEV